MLNLTSILSATLFILWIAIMKKVGGFSAESRSISTSTTLHGLDYASMRLPKLIAFDLDGTVWTPDMYQLWGGGPPFKHHSNGKDLIDRAGTSVRLLGITAQILADIHSNEHFRNKATKIAWVSCTDEPEWADECLAKFKTAHGLPLNAVVDSSEIYKSNKQSHFRNLQRKYPDIAFEDMLFFDNESGNINTVSRLGVKSIYCPDGMTKEVWEHGLRQYHDSPHHNNAPRK